MQVSKKQLPKELLRMFPNGSPVQQEVRLPRLQKHCGGGSQEDGERRLPQGVRRSHQVTHYIYIISC